MLFKIYARSIKVTQYCNTIKCKESHKYMIHYNQPMLLHFIESVQILAHSTPTVQKYKSILINPLAVFT